jgi:hypothetical protein
VFDANHKPIFTKGWDSSKWRIYKLARSATEQISTIAGNVKLAGYLNLAGTVDDAVDLFLPMASKPNSGDVKKLSNFWHNSARIITDADELESILSHRDSFNGAMRAREDFNRMNSIITRIDKGIGLLR